MEESGLLQKKDYCMHEGRARILKEMDGYDEAGEKKTYIKQM